MKKLFFLMLLQFAACALVAQQQEPVNPQIDIEVLEGYTIKLIPAQGGTNGYDIFDEETSVVIKDLNPFTIEPTGLIEKQDANKVEQCRFIKITSDGNKVILIPCDFPVLNFASATKSDIEAFNTVVSDWKSNNPGFDDLSFLPESTLEYFEISKSNYDAFSEERKSIISSASFFYQIN
jgi:hypothetical protein